MNYLILSTLIFKSISHGNMATPSPRGNLQWWGFCSRGKDCLGTCDAPKSESNYHEPWTPKKYYQRGENIEIKWLRHNHPGGFVRLAIVPFDLSDNSEAFDQNIIKYVCYETNCKEDYNDPYLGELNGPGMGECSTNMIIPDNLDDGTYTLQWTWFGGGVLEANPEAAFANYVSCSDFTIEGGNELSYSKSPPIFQGGDVAFPYENKCRYWSNNYIYNCINGAEKGESCGFGPFQSGPPRGFY